MIAVIKTGGKQYSVKAGQILKVEKLEGKKGDSVSLDSVLALTDTKSHTVGNPLVQGASVEAKILEQIRDKKIIVFKKRRRKNYRSTQGHRQYLTVLQIESIKHGTKSFKASKEAESPKEKAQEKKEFKKSDKKVIKKEATMKKKSTKISKKKVVVKKTKKEKK